MQKKEEYALVVLMSPQPNGRGGHTAFGADPVGVGVGVAHCLHSVSRTNLTKLAQTHYWQEGKKW